MTVAVVFEEVHLLNGGDVSHGQLIQCRLQSLVVVSGGLTDGLVLPAHGTLTSSADGSEGPPVFPTNLANFSGLNGIEEGGRGEGRGEGKRERRATRTRMRQLQSTAARETQTAKTRLSVNWEPMEALRRWLHRNCEA